MEELLLAARLSIDAEEREEVYYEIQELWSDEVVAIPLTQQFSIAVSQSDVGGVVLAPGAFLRYWLLFKD